MKKVYGERSKKKKTKVQTVRIKYTLALPARAECVVRCMETLNGVFRRLFSDENFVTLLRAESMKAIPEFLKPLVEEGRDGHEIG
jgi:hypothetical protein